MAKVKVDAPSSAAHGARITPSVKVSVSGAKPNANVTITLEHTHDRAPYWGPRSQTKRADAMGNASASFDDVVIEKQQNATLRGTADDGSTYFNPGTDTVTVT